jgi:hypothetical protein
MLQNHFSGREAKSIDAGTVRHFLQSSHCTHSKAAAEADDLVLSVVEEVGELELELEVEVEVEVLLVVELTALLVLEFVVVLLLFVVGLADAAGNEEASTLPLLLVVVCGATDVVVGFAGVVDVDTLPISTVEDKEGGGGMLGMDMFKVFAAEFVVPDSVFTSAAGTELVALLLSLFVVLTACVSFGASISVFLFFFGFCACSFAFSASILDCLRI